MEEMGLTKNPELPKFTAVPPEWQYVSMRCLKDAARKIMEAEPRAEGMPEPLMVELVDFIADEMKDGGLSRGVAPCLPSDDDDDDDDDDALTTRPAPFSP